MIKKLVLFLMAMAVICYCLYRGIYADEVIIREDELGVTQVYEGDQIYEFRREEAKRIKLVAEDFGKALAARNESKLMKLSHYEGFASEKKETLLKVIEEYQDREGMELRGVEIRSVKTDELAVKAKVVAFLDHRSEDDNIESAPSLERWTFVYKHGKWRFLIEKQ